MTMQTSRFSIVHFRDIERWIPLRTIFDSKKIPLSWSVVSVSDIVSQVEERVKVDKDKEYKLIGVKWYGEGTFHRETVLGSETSATYLHPVIPNALIYNRLFAWKKSCRPSSARTGKDLVGLSNNVPSLPGAATVSRRP